MNRFVLACILFFCGAAAAENFVADPARSEGVRWAKHDIKGRDYWLIVHEAMAALKDLADEPFVRDSGTMVSGSRFEPSVTRKNPWGIAGPGDRYVTKGPEVVTEGWLLDRLARAPFEFCSPLELNRVNNPHMVPEDIDCAGWDRLAAHFPETFLGVRFNEWDAGVLHALGRYDSKGCRLLHEMGTYPCNRAEMRENFHRHWQQAQVRNGRRMFGLSGATNFEHWGCEWGGSVSALETCGNLEFPIRNHLMFARSAARQFDVPMLAYTAYYRLQWHPDSRPDRFGAEAGIETSLAWRQHLLAYYMGANLQSFESMPWGHVERVGESHVLTPNGREIKRLYEWTRSEKGARGECYTPILFLVDRAHGFDQLDGNGITGINGIRRGPFMGAYAPSPADYYTDYALRTISPRYKAMYHPSYLDFPTDKSGGVRNSPVGDIFDVFIANSDVPGRELRDDQLARYAVVMPLGDIVWNGELVNRIRKYVYEGGTFVATATQAQPFNEELGIKNDELRKNTPSFIIPHSSFLTNTAAKAFGKGNFILVTNDWMAQEKEPWKVPQQMKDLLQQLHDEVVPFKITGECSFLYNWVPEGAREDTSTTDRSARVSRAGYWKAIIMNNAGTAKEGAAKNAPPDPKWTRTVTLELPEDAEVEEVLEGLKPRIAEKKVGGESRWTKEKLVSFDVLSGHVIVVNVRGIKNKNSTVQPQPSTSTSSPLTPSSFPDQVYKPHPVYDRFRYDPALDPPRPKTPALVFAWKNPTDGVQPVVSNGYLHAKWTLPRCTVEATAKWSGAPADAGHRSAAFYIGSQIGVETNARGHWQAFAFCYPYNAVIEGPKAEPGRWTDFRLEYDRGFVKFFVDGVEYRDPQRGVLQAPTVECRDAFFSRFEVAIGQMTHGWLHYFKGTVRSLRVTAPQD